MTTLAEALRRAGQANSIGPAPCGSCGGRGYDVPLPF